MRERGSVTRINTREARVNRWAQMVGDSAQAKQEIRINIVQSIFEALAV